MSESGQRDERVPLAHAVQDPGAATHEPDATMEATPSAGFEWTDATRFAVYYAPAAGSPWWEAGCQWLGRDPQTGSVLTPPVLDALSQRGTDVPALTGAPSRYGWHGTLVAPARCAAGVSPSQVLASTHEWAATQAGFSLSVEAASLGQFVALRPSTDEGAAAIREIASSALITLGPLRDRPTAQEVERRLGSNLTGRQREMLTEWGYPYVFDEFRFHMTLSNSLDDDADRHAIRDWWNTRIAALGPLEIDGVALFVEPAPGQPFVLWARVALGAQR